MRWVFGNISITLLFISPLLTMKLFAEEKKLGTVELLRTSPLTSWEIVLGKYLAVIVVYMALVMTTLVYVPILYWVGKPEAGILIAGYLGLILIGAAWLSAGLFSSTLSENQVVSAVIGFVFLLMLFVLHWAEGLIEGWLGKIISKLYIQQHYAGFAKGVIDTTDVVYFALFAFLFLFLSVRRLEAERWSG